MSAQILEGKTLATAIQNDIQHRIALRLKQGLRAPGLAVILIGTDPASKLYVKNKHSACHKVGIHSQSHYLPETCTEKELLTLIDSLNADNNIDGILLQLPLPRSIDTDKVIEHIHPKKDVDGFHPYNLGRLAEFRPLFRPCTPAGIMHLLSSTKTSLEGLNASVVGISNIVGKPMILELLMAGCTVTACHIQTKDLSKHILGSDIVVSAVGIPYLIKGEWIKQGAIVIDVGMNRVQDGQFVGDLDFEAAKKQAAWITPVPGGVGPMTVAYLLLNTMMAFELHTGQIA